MNITIKIIPDSGSNSLTFSKNFRIFSVDEPIYGVGNIEDILEDVEVTSPNAIDFSNLKRHLRYSNNKIDWSLWYSFSPTQVDPNGLDQVKDIEFEKDCDLYIEIKYEYDDGGFEELDSIISIDEIKIRLKKIDKGLPNVLTPIVCCSDEKCPALIFEKDARFRPYQVDSAIGIFKELSFHTNKIFGHEVVYFRTMPESDSGDYIFKEWTLFKNIDRKCVKILVPANKFPDNKPKFSEYGIDFELPFEIHIDNRYFQSIFGKGSEPRRRDFLYFPLINRMFEIQGSYLYRSFMMDPTYWKVQLIKFNPNIDMLMKDENRKYMDNIITSAEELFAEEVTDAIEDGTMPDQYKTISRRFDASRKSIHPDLKIKPIQYTFNYASLMENYYDLRGIEILIDSYGLTNDNPPTSSTDQHLLEDFGTVDTKEKFKVVRAYQSSDIFGAWANNELMTNDKNVLGTSVRYLRVRGPFASELGAYVQLEAYTDLTFQKQKDIMVDDSISPGNDILNLKLRSTAIVYNSNPVFGKDNIDNLSFTSIFNIPNDAGTVSFIKGYDNQTQSGMYIYAQFNKYAGNSNNNGDLILRVKLNNNERVFSIPDFKSGEWHGMVVSVSNEFNQIGVYIYETVEDPADLNNHTDFKKVFESISSMQTEEFEIEQPYNVPSSNILLTNVRLFSTMIKEEEHDFILSQQFIKDESMLLLIDNCRPQVKVPFISRNR